MGLDAEVSCPCYQQGRVVSPFPEQTIIDAEGWLDLNVPYEGHEAEHDRFETWRSRACEHPMMTYCRVHLSNWSGYRMFQAALEEAGWEHFPTLCAHLPNGNGGAMSAQAAAVALQELETFRRIYQGTVTVLVNAETGEVERTYIEAYDGLFRFGPKYEVGFDPHGLYVREPSEPRAEYFRSRWFEQRLGPVEGNRPTAPREVTLIDLATGQQFAGPVAVTDPPTHSTLRVEERTQTAERFRYILEPLVLVCRAAIETGNPVRWC